MNSNRAIRDLWAAAQGGDRARVFDYWLLGACFIAAYVSIERATFSFQLDGLGITLWSPSAGLSLVLLIGRGRSYAPFVFAASLITDYAVYSGPRGWVAPMATSLILTIGLSILAIGLKKTVDFLNPRLLQIVALLVVVPIGILAIAVLYCLVLAATGQLSSWSYPTAVRNFWIGDTLGIITVVPAAPIALMLLTKEWRSLLRRYAVDGVVFVVLLFVAFWIIFGLQRAHEFQFFYLLFLPVVWIAVRHGYAGISVALPFAHVSLVTIATFLGYAAYDFMAFQMVMLVLSGTGLLLGAAVTQGRCSDERLRSQQSELARAARHALVGATGTALAHEISQPLSSATNYIHTARRLLQARTEIDPDVSDALNKAAGEAQRTRETLERVRDYVSSGRLELTQVDIVGTSQRIVSLIRRDGLARGVEIDVCSTSHLPPIRADAIQLEQLLLNLVSNAVDAASQAVGRHGRVTVRVQQRGDRVVISVEDNGSGISEEIADRLFEPFETTKQQGMGLGLTLARQIVIAHSGRLYCENRLPHGACFTAELYVDGPR